MAKIKFEDGTVVNFDGEPTQQDIEEVEQKIYGGQQLIQEQPKKLSELQREQQIREKGKTILGLEMTPAMEKTIPGRIAKFGKEAITIPALHFFNQAGMNYPRYMGEQFGQEYPEATTLPGKVLSKGAGIAGIAMSPITKAILGAFGLGSKVISGTMKLGEKMLRGAGASATLGGLYGQPMEQRIPAAITSGVLGAGIELAGAGIQKGVKALRKAKAPAKLKPTQRISFLSEEARKKYGIEEIKLKKQKLNWEKQDTRQIINEKIRQSNLLMKQQISQIDDNIAKSAQTGSITFQEKLPEFFKTNSKAYGNRLDEISEALINQKGVAITKGELNDIIQKTLFEVQQIGIGQGQPNTYLNMLSNKYALKEGLDSFGNIITDANIPVDLRQAIYDMRSIWKSISAQARQGKFTDNDIVASMLKKNWGSWVEKFAPELQELNTSYKPIIQAMKESARIFKPAQGEIATKQAEQFLTRLGRGKLSGGEKKLLNMIEEGTKFAEGIGEISQGVKRLGAERVTAIAKQELNRAYLQQQLTGKLTKFQQQERQLAETINQNRQQLNIRLNQLGSRKEYIMKLMANRDRANRIRKALLVGGAIAGASTIPHSIQRLLYRVRTNE